MALLIRIPLLLLFLLPAADSLAQEAFISIKGKLLDKESKEPIPYASIYLKGKTIGTTSNEEGRFIFHVPLNLSQDTLIVSVIGYSQFKSKVSLLTGKDTLLELKQSAILFQEVTISTSKKKLSGNEIVKIAYQRIPDNYPMTPFIIEGFFRDLQKEDEKPVGLLEAALRFRYKDYNPGYEEVEIVEVKKSFNKRHPVNGTYDRQNSIIDLMEDNYIKHRFGPIRAKGWKFVVDSILTYDHQTVYKISGRKSPSESCEMYIDSKDYSVIKVELKTQMINGQFYRRYLNLPDPYGQQQTSFRMIFEFQKIDNKMYLKYQREEDTYNLFNKTTNEIILKQAYVKELFVNNVIQTPPDSSINAQMNINKSVEGQAKPYNASFWRYYNIPIETSKFSTIARQLQELEFTPDK
jgi:hypothetical protein